MSDASTKIICICNRKSTGFLFSNSLASERHWVQRPLKHAKTLPSSCIWPQLHSLASGAILYPKHLSQVGWEEEVEEVEVEQVRHTADELLCTYTGTPLAKLLSSLQLSSCFPRAGASCRNKIPERGRILSEIWKNSFSNFVISKWNSHRWSGVPPQG